MLCAIQTHLSPAAGRRPAGPRTRLLRGRARPAALVLLLL